MKKTTFMKKEKKKNIYENKMLLYCDLFLHLNLAPFLECTVFIYIVCTCVSRHFILVNDNGFIFW